MADDFPTTIKDNYAPKTIENFSHNREKLFVVIVVIQLDVTKTRTFNLKLNGRKDLFTSLKLTNYLTVQRPFTSDVIVTCFLTSISAVFLSFLIFWLPWLTDCVIFFCFYYCCCCNYCKGIVLLNFPPKKKIIFSFRQFFSLLNTQLFRKNNFGKKKQSLREFKKKTYKFYKKI